MMFKSLIYTLKKIQFTLRTWKNSIEISRAYGPSLRAGTPKRVVREGLIWGFIVVFLGCLMWFAVVQYTAMKERQIRPEPRHVVTAVESPATPPPVSPRAAPLVSSVPAVETVPVIPPPPPPPVRPVVKKYPYIPVTDTADFLVLVANKACKALYVLQKQQAEWRVVKEYAIAIGEQEGRKVTAGDKRTPEGLYCIIGRKEKNELASIYGPLAYVLDYPNEEDRRAGRTGQGIWIHGTEPDSAPFQTRGCLEMDNRDLVALSQMLKKGVGVPVLIVSDSTLTDIPSRPDYALCKTRREQALAISSETVEQFGKIVASWKKAWETKDIAQYETFYDTVRFSGQGLTWGGWKERKLRTFGLYDTIAIAIDKMRIVKETDTKLIIKFLQRYTTNINTIENGKKLWFEKVNDFWKITGESTCTMEELLL